MPLIDYLLSPRKDHRGWETPSEASRILLILVIVLTSFWAWPISDGIIFIWLAIVLTLSTLILSVSWWLLSLMGQNRESRDLVPYLRENQSK